MKQTCFYLPQRESKREPSGRWGEKRVVEEKYDRKLLS